MGFGEVPFVRAILDLMREEMPSRSPGMGCTNSTHRFVNRLILYLIFNILFNQLCDCHSQVELSCVFPHD